MGDPGLGGKGGANLDEIARGLQRLRVAAGSPSYAEIVRLIAEDRKRRSGVEVGVAPGRTTVYDAFRLGRRRVDAALVGEIVRALGGDDAEVAAWRQRCVLASAGGDAVPEASGREPARESGREPIGVPGGSGAAGAEAAAGATLVGSGPDLGAEPSTQPSTQPSAEPGVEPGSRRGVAGGAGRLSVWQIVVVLLAAVAVNVLGRLVADFLEAPLYLDMVGTAFVAIALGPWWGAAVGAASNVVRGALIASTSLPFAVVNVAGALVWGYGVRRFGLHRSVSRFLLLCAGVAVTCSLVATPILVYGFGGHNHHGSDRMTETFLGLHLSLLVSVFAANLLASLLDKVVSGFVALGAVEALLGRAPTDDGGVSR
ncbi:ECF transporter S component [Nocardioides sp. GY 10113]|uniref:ECF transporter S component n=1 Tax=Nocardioides sp. GY 10113 TaxID=2569761 RepID=UPI0010A7F4B8|nr:ECF transporter S component [Nocardioides sp. GY 10113]TIC86283.1 ECF transporter S component [Nocardioides sp. GY 10113]